MLRTGRTELLPATMIFDEAHQLPEVAGLFFGESVSTSQVIELARDTRNEAIVTAKDYPALQDAALALDKAARDLRLAEGRERAAAARLAPSSSGVAGRPSSRTRQPRHPGRALGAGHCCGAPRNWG